MSLTKYPTKFWIFRITETSGHEHVFTEGDYDDGSLSYIPADGVTVNLDSVQPILNRRTQLVFPTAQVKLRYGDAEHDYLWDWARTARIEGAVCSLSLADVSTGVTTPTGTLIFNGEVYDKSVGTEGDTLVIDLVARGFSALNKPFPTTKITRAIYPKCNPMYYGQIEPLVFGRFSGYTAQCVEAGPFFVLAADIGVGETEIELVQDATDILRGPTGSAATGTSDYDYDSAADWIIFTPDADASWRGAHSVLVADTGEVIRVNYLVLGTDSAISVGERGYLNTTASQILTTYTLVPLFFAECENEWLFYRYVDTTVIGDCIRGVNRTPWNGQEHRAGAALSATDYEVMRWLIARGSLSDVTGIAAWDGTTLSVLTEWTIDFSDSTTASDSHVTTTASDPNVAYADNTTVVLSMTVAGYLDTAAGIWTGTPSAVIERPCDVIAYLMMAMGVDRDIIDIELFALLRTDATLPARFGIGLVTAERAADIIAKLAIQSGFLVYFDGKKWKGKRYPTSSSVVAADIGPWHISDGSLSCEWTKLDDITNALVIRHSPNYVTNVSTAYSSRKVGYFGPERLRRGGFAQPDWVKQTGFRQPYAAVATDNNQDSIDRYGEREYEILADGIVTPADAQLLAAALLTQGSHKVRAVVNFDCVAEAAETLHHLDVVRISSKRQPKVRYMETLPTPTRYSAYTGSTSELYGKYVVFSINRTSKDVLRIGAIEL